MICQNIFCDCSEQMRDASKSKRILFLLIHVVIDRSVDSNENHTILDRKEKGGREHG